MNRAKTRLGLFTGTGVLVTAAIVVLLNLLSQQFFLRFDWSAGHRYSLSKASKKLVRGLNDTLVVKAYFSETLPEPLATNARYARDLLKEYRAAARGRVRLEFLNPDASEKIKGEANSAGLIDQPFQIVARDQFQVRKGFFGMVLFYQDKQETFPFIQDTDNLEYDISSRVKRMIAAQKPALGVVTGHGERNVEAYHKGNLEGLDQRFAISGVTLSTPSVRPDILLIMAPKTRYSEEDIKGLDAFIQQGVPVMFFGGRRTVDVGSFATYPRDTGLEPLFAHYGLRMDEDLVLDLQAQRISLQSNQGGYQIRNIIDYPAMPLANTLNKKHPVTAPMDVLGFFFASPIFVSTTVAQEVRVTPLAESSRASWIAPGLSRIEPYELQPPQPTDPKGPFILAALAEGKAPAFTDPSRTVEKLRLVVAGSSYFADPQMPNPETNAAFVIGMAEWLAQDENLLAIPIKGAAFRPLRKLSPLVQQAVKIAGYFFLPALVILGGFARWRLRQRRRRVVADIYKPEAVRA